jgi:vacuolar-type H+-ATPase subunit E/Vma4
MRLKVLTAREEALRAVLSDTSARLASFASPASPAYKNLLADLVTQAAAKLAAAGALKVRCRAVDQAAVTEAIAKASKSLPGVSITLDAAAALPPPPDAARPDAPACLGGVVVVSADGAQTVSNTLEDRLHISYELNVPTLRIKFFGKSGGHLRA